jgi:endonuclease III
MRLPAIGNITQLSAFQLAYKFRLAFARTVPCSCPTSMSTPAKVRLLRPRRRVKSELDAPAMVPKQELAAVTLAKLEPETTAGPSSVKRERKIEPAMPAKRGKEATKSTWSALADAPDIEELEAATARVNDLLRSAGLVVDAPDAEKMAQSVIDSLFATILSQATTKINSTRAFAALKTAFPTWDQADAAGPDAIENEIQCAGLGNRKAARMHQILQAVKAEFGEYSLDSLRDEPDDSVVIAKLVSYPGIGPKTASCVLMFNLSRAELPVDTHVNRISQRLGWVRQGSKPNETYAVLNNVVAASRKYELHVQLIEHGRKTCKALAPQCGSCALSSICPSRFEHERR